MDIKRPRFDGPKGFGATTETPGFDPQTIKIVRGTKVTLMYQGKQLAAVVTAVEMPGAMFLARVLGFDGQGFEHGDLSSGDCFRFRREDVRWID